MIYLLHEKYILRDRDFNKEKGRIEYKIAESFKTITWITYRDTIEKPLLNSTYTNDAGWGCMVRTGQMLMF